MEAVNIQFAPATGTDQEWNEAYARLADFFRAYRLHNRIRRTQLVLESLRRACGATPVHELTDFLDRSPGWEGVTLRETRLRVGLHVPCTQRHVVRRGDSARALLARIPGITVLPAPESGCCGAAGMQRWLFPEQAARRVAPLRDWARAQPLDALCSANVGCRIHLELALADGTLLPTRHPLELLDEHLA